MSRNHNEQASRIMDVALAWTVISVIAVIIMLTLSLLGGCMSHTIPTDPVSIMDLYHRARDNGEVRGTSCALEGWERPITTRGGFAHIEAPWCDRCDSSGYPADSVQELNGYQHPVVCPNWWRMRGVERFNEARFPAEHVRPRTGYYATALPQLRAIKEGGITTSYYIHGPVGTGKSFIAYQIGVRAVLQQGMRVRWWDMSTLLERIVASIRDGAEPISIGSFEVYDLLILDDVGKALTSHEAKVLDQIISRRYNEKALIIATSNYDIRELSKRIEGRIASRFAGMCTPILVDGEDRRLS